MNKYGKALYIMGWLMIILGFFGSFVLAGTLSTGYSDFNMTVFLSGMLSCTFLAMLLFGLGEIINILDDNRKYLKALTEKLSTQEEELKEKELKDELPDI